MVLAREVKTWSMGQSVPISMQQLCGLRFCKTITALFLDLYPHFSGHWTSLTTEDLYWVEHSSSSHSTLCQFNCEWLIFFMEPGCSLFINLKGNKYKDKLYKNILITSKKQWYNRMSIIVMSFNSTHRGHCSMNDCLTDLSAMQAESAPSPCHKLWADYIALSWKAVFISAVP